MLLGSQDNASNVNPMIYSLIQQENEDTVDIKTVPVPSLILSHLAVGAAATPTARTSYVLLGVRALPPLGPI